MKTFKDYINNKTEINEESPSGMESNIFELNKDRVGKKIIGPSGKELENSIVVSKTILAQKSDGFIIIDYTDMSTRYMSKRMYMDKEDIKMLAKL